MLSFKRSFVVTTALLLAFTYIVATYPNATARSIEDAARDYRLNIYHTFRQRREEYNQRREAGDQLLEKWRNGTLKSVPEDELVRWFDDASRVSVPLAVATLPPIPASVISGEKAHAKALATTTANGANNLAAEQDSIGGDVPEFAQGHDHAYSPSNEQDSVSGSGHLGGTPAFNGAAQSLVSAPADDFSAGSASASDAAIAGDNQGAASGVQPRYTRAIVRSLLHGTESALDSQATAQPQLPFEHSDDSPNASALDELESEFEAEYP